MQNHPGYVRQIPNTYEDPSLKGFKRDQSYSFQATDFSLWTEKEIQGYLDNKGEDYDDCHTKIDLIQRAKECESNTGQKALKPVQQTEPQQSVDEVDPLDAFMSEMNDMQANLNTDEQLHKTKKQKEVYHNDDDDHVAEFLEARQRDPEYLQKQAMLANSGYDSDENVYQTAKMMENQNVQVDYDSDDQVVGVRKKDVEPLPIIDHSLINYESFNKDFYQEAPSIKNMTEDQIFEIKRSMQIKVQGLNSNRPISSFGQCGFTKQVMDVLKKYGYEQPTPIQCQALPCALSGRDVLGVAKTGSGKTAAYLLPMIVHIMDQRKVNRDEGPVGIVLAPTRELSEQIHKECKRFSKPYALKVCAAFGGLNKYEQIKELRSGVEIAVGTPGRVIDLIKGKGCSLTRVTYSVLDEADKMFEMGMEYQVRSIMNNIRPDRQTLLFTATMPKKVERLAQDHMKYPIRITVGQEGVANADIQQMTEIMQKDEQKLQWLLEKLPSLIDEGQVLVFVNQKIKVDIIVEELKKFQYKVGGIQGDMDQYSRMEVLNSFKGGTSHVLVATDVAARGLDIKEIKTVINYDSPNDISTYIHRVGRTGRAGDKEGAAYSLVLENEVKFAGQLASMLQQTDQPISVQLRMVAMKDKKFNEGFNQKKKKYNQGGQTGRNVGGAGLGFNKGYTNAGIDTLNKLYGSQNQNNQQQTGAVNKGFQTNTFVPGFQNSSNVIEPSQGVQITQSAKEQQKNFKTGQRDMLKDYYTGQFKTQFGAAQETVGGKPIQQATVVLPQKRSTQATTPQLTSVHERPLYNQAPPKHFSSNYRSSINTYNQQQSQQEQGQSSSDYSRAIEQAKLIAQRLAAKKS